MLIKALDAHLKLTDRMAACLPDHRNPDKVRHAVRDLSKAADETKGSDPFVLLTTQPFKPKKRTRRTTAAVPILDAMLFMLHAASLMANVGAQSQ